MGCENRITGNTNCDNCTLRRSMRRNSWGGTGLSRDRARRGNRMVVREHGDPWIGTEDRDVVICNREIGILVVDNQS